jgi:preprotein translocase subunit SecG
VDKFILIVHVMVAISIVGLILLQRSTADGGAAFGGGSQQSLLGTVGSAPLLTKITVGLVAVFFATSLTLAYFNRHFNDDVILIPEVETVSETGIADDQLAPQVTVNPVNDDLPVTPTSEENISDIPAVPAQ